MLAEVHASFHAFWVLAVSLRKLQNLSRCEWEMPILVALRLACVMVGVCWTRKMAPLMLVNGSQASTELQRKGCPVQVLGVFHGYSFPWGDDTNWVTGSYSSGGCLNYPESYTLWSLCFLPARETPWSWNSDVRWWHFRGSMGTRRSKWKWHCHSAGIRLGPGIPLHPPLVHKNLYHFFSARLLKMCSISEAKTKGARIRAASGRARANVCKKLGLQCFQTCGIAWGAKVSHNPEVFDC